MSVRIESQTADKRRSLRVHEVRLPLVPDPEEPGFFQSDEDYFYKLDNGESLKVSSSWEPSDEELEFSVDVKYKNASISQSGKSGLLINFCHKNSLPIQYT